MEEKIRPFLRWAGGKTWIIPFVSRTIANIEFNNYHEPFLGGGAIYFAISSGHKAYLSDINKKLIKTYNAVRKDYNKVFFYLEKMKNTKDEYYRIRSENYTNEYERAAQFIYLNHNSYNGLYRVNRNGRYNVPYGFHKTFNFSISRLSSVCNYFKKTKVVFKVQDFAHALAKVKKGDFVFLDPPYTVSNGKDNGFIEYNDKVFSLDDQKRLAEEVVKLNEIGAYFILTNANHETIYEIFKNTGRLLNLNRSSLIGGINAKRGNIGEYVFTNIPEK